MSVLEGRKALTDPWIACVWLIAAYVVHLVEEWAFDFSGWSRVVRGEGVSPNEFLAINAVFLAIVIAAALWVRKNRGIVWVPVTLAGVFVINSILHTLATWRYEVYSPGTATGLLIYLPLGLWVLVSLRPKLSAGSFAGCLVGAVVIHAFVSLVAFR